MSIEKALPATEPEPLPFSADVVVIGAGPTGSTAARKLAEEAKSVLILDIRDVLHITNPPCTGCVGLVPNDILNILRERGVIIPLEIIKQELKGFVVHLPKGNQLVIPAEMVSVNRGWGASQEVNKEPGFDTLLLQSAIDAGAKFMQARVESIEHDEAGNPELTINLGGEKQTISTKMVIGAMGAHSQALIENTRLPHGGELSIPETIKAAVFEFEVEEEYAKNVYEDYSHIVIVPMGEMNVNFAAFVPKNGGRVSVALMGNEDVTMDDAKQFFDSKYLHGLLPQTDPFEKLTIGAHGMSCMCIRNSIVVFTAKDFIAPGMILAGDSGRTRLLKGGIWAGLRTGQAAAQAVIKGDIGHYEKFANKEFPQNDRFYMNALMRINDLMLKAPGGEKLLTKLHPNSIFASLIEEYMYHLLVGDISYRGILPRLIRNISDAIYHADKYPD